MLGKKTSQFTYNLFFCEHFDEQQGMVDEKIRFLKEALDFIPFSSVSNPSIFTVGWLEAPKQTFT